MKNETIIVFGAHSDDFVLGAGGTIAKYTNEGKRVITIVFSFGESSHPWLKETVIQKMRSKEALEASKILNCQTYVYDLKEFNFLEEYKIKKVDQVILKLISKYKPNKIFTHSNEDPHPDHRRARGLQGGTDHTGVSGQGPVARSGARGGSRVAGRHQCRRRNDRAGARRRAS